MYRIVLLANSTSTVFTNSFGIKVSLLSLLQYSYLADICWVKRGGWRAAQSQTGPRPGPPHIQSDQRQIFISLIKKNSVFSSKRTF